MTGLGIWSIVAWVGASGALFGPLLRPVCRFDSIINLVFVAVVVVVMLMSCFVLMHIWWTRIVEIFLSIALSLALAHGSRIYLG